MTTPGSACAGSIKERPMPTPDMTVVAEGNLPTGEHWIFKAGGTTDDYYTFLETVHPDGHRDEGGMGGRPLFPGQYLNTYTGGHDQGLRRVIVRSDPRVHRLLMELNTGERRELPPVGTDPAMHLTFFAALLPWATCPVTLEAFDDKGHVLPAETPRRIPPPPWDT
jgi:hypothetical protein